MGCNEMQAFTGPILVPALHTLFFFNRLVQKIGYRWDWNLPLHQISAHTASINPQDHSASAKKIVV